ncbi:MAG: pentapeptide repeat-containing protein, partial [Rhodobacteraceae bacterium]|nr:pentapeptide repeat-containing protein [Paracoccaceae bacterium]
MTEKEDNPKTLPKAEALALARQGKDVWNKWADENPGMAVDFSYHEFKDGRVSFSRFIFPGAAVFLSAIFDDVSFHNAEFRGGPVDFSRANFRTGTADFNGVKFGSGHTYFIGTEFRGGGAYFVGAVFGGGNCAFSGAKFIGDAFFMRANFSGGKASFLEAEFSVGSAIFVGADFCGGSADFDHACFNGRSTDFSRARFSMGNAYFRNTQFNGGNSYFTYAQFSGGNAIFSKAKFSGGDAEFKEVGFKGGAAIFDSVVFSGGHAFFPGAVFANETSFAGTVFEGPINMEGSKFAHVPDFRRSKLSAHFTLHDMAVEYPTTPVKLFSIFPCRKAKTSADADRFRRLKELAVQARDHEREQDFFAKELMAKRFYETKGFALIPSYLYEWTSDFGRSLLRPVICLIMTWLLFGFIYGMNNIENVTSIYGPLWDGLKLSLATLVPF